MRRLAQFEGSGWQIDFACAGRTRAHRWVRMSLLEATLAGWQPNRRGWQAGEGVLRPSALAPKWLRTNPEDDDDEEEKEERSGV